MNLPTRSAFVALGLILIAQATAQIHSGRIVFNNASYHQQTFAAGGIGVGIILILVAFLPLTDWLYRHITTKKRSPHKKTH